MNNENNIDLHSYDTSSSSSDYLEPPYYTSSLPVSILIDGSFAILSALTGAAILANNYCACASIVLCLLYAFISPPSYKYI